MLEGEYNMNNDITNANNNENNDNTEVWDALMKTIFQKGLATLKPFFPHVEGLIVNDEKFGQIFIYRVTNDFKKTYDCGFFLRELAEQFQDGGREAGEWMASFFYELMKSNKGGKELPAPPDSEQKEEQFIDDVLFPHCLSAVSEEFAPLAITGNRGLDENLTPVLELGFKDVPEEKCVFPIHYLYKMMQLNRDPSDTILVQLAKLRQKYGVE